MYKYNLFGEFRGVMSRSDLVEWFFFAKFKLIGYIEIQIKLS
jgi:hypothetical protein